MSNRKKELDMLEAHVQNPSSWEAEARELQACIQSLNKSGLYEEILTIYDSAQVAVGQALGGDRISN